MIRGALKVVQAAISDIVSLDHDGGPPRGGVGGGVDPQLVG